MNTYFPEPSSVLSSMFYQFEPDNDFAIRCIPVILLKKANLNVLRLLFFEEYHYLFFTGMPDDDIPVVTKVRPRGQPPQQNFSINVPSDDEEEVDEGEKY
jgi:hypothetical protein